MTMRNSGSNLSLTTYAPIFLKGTISNGLFTPDTTTPFVITKANCNVPGAYYMYIGDATGATTISYATWHPYYYYDGSNLLLYAEFATSAVEAKHAASAGYAVNAASANYALSANSAVHATHAGSATWATTAGNAVNAAEAIHAGSAGYAASANSAAHAIHAGSAGYASSAGAVAWGNVTGKPSSFSPSSHTHYELATIGDQRSTTSTPDTYKNKLIFQGLKAKATIGNPSSDTYSYVVGLRGWSDASGGDSHELAFNNTGLYWRHGATSTWGTWNRIVTNSGNWSIGVASASYASSAGYANTASQAIYSASAGYASTAGRAIYSVSAGYANTAGSAIHAASAGYANTAANAVKASQDGSGNTITTTYATKTELNNVMAANDAMRFKGTIGTNGTAGVTIPSNSYLIGDTYKIITAGTYAGVVCEPGDMIIAIADGPTSGDTVTNAHWTVVQTNIDGAVTGPTSATDGQVALFNGTSGKVIKAATKSTGTVVTGVTLSGGAKPTLGSAITASYITGWSAGSVPSLTLTTVTASAISSWSAGSAPSLTLSTITASVVTGWSAGTTATLTTTTVTASYISAWSAGSAAALSTTNVTASYASGWNAGT